VVQVGDGRGFVVEGNNRYFAPWHCRRLIATAAHCLSKLPPCHTFMYLNEKTWKNLIGPLGGKPSVAVECLFADPLSDLAVLGPPDDEELYEQFEAYEAFVESAIPLPIAEAGEAGEAWLLSLDNNWFKSWFNRNNWGPMWVSKLEGSIVGGMSGSPILNSEGAAIGCVNLGSLTSEGKKLVDTKLDSIGDPQTVLCRNLPGWMLA
jgi:Trypsin-like peptidase domain